RTPPTQRRSVALRRLLFPSLLIPPPPTSPLFPYTTLFRSAFSPTARLPTASPRRRGAKVRRSPSPTRTSASATARRTWRRSSARDRKSTRLNSSHLGISYAVFCLKKKNKQQHADEFKREAR